MFEPFISVYQGLLSAGCDEVGRGPLAGDVVAAAVILDPENPIEGLDDSKSVLIAARNDGFFDLQKYGQGTSEQLSFHFYLNSNNQSKSLVTITSRDSFELRINTVLKTEQKIKKSVTTSTFDLDLNPGSNLIEIDFSKSKKPEGFYLHF